MKAGSFNIDEYLEKLEKLNETLEGNNKISSEGGDVADQDGILIPDANKKSYDWLKKEYNANQTEVKVEITKGGAKFEPSDDIQASNDSSKDLKTGMFGEPAKKEEPKKEEEPAKKEEPKKEEEPAKKEKPEKTNDKEDDIKDKEEKKEEPIKKDKEEKDDKKQEIKKIDLKAKKT